MPSFEELMKAGGTPVAAPASKGFSYEDLVNQGGVPNVAETFSPAETFGLNATNVFGAAPALHGVLQHLLHGTEYSEARDRHRAKIEQASEQNPKAAFLGKVGALVPETLIGGGVGKIAQGAIKGGQVAAKLAGFAESSPVLSGITKGLASGASYGAASGAGTALSEGKDVLPAVGEGAAIGGALGGALGGVAGKISKTFRGAATQEAEDLLTGVARGSGEKGSATVTAKKLLDRDKVDIVRTLREEKNLRKLYNKPAKEALPAFHEALEETGAKLDPHYEAIDKATGGVSVHNLINSLDQEAQRLAKDPLNEKAVEAVNDIKNSIVKAWAPRLLATEKSHEVLRGMGKEIPESLVGADVFVPSKEVRKVVTRLQTRGSNVINSLNPGEASELKSELGSMMKEILDSNLGVAAENFPHLAGDIEKLNALNSKYSALKNISKAIAQRGWKENTGGTTGHGLIKGLFSHGGLAGAAAMAAHGNLPGAAGVLAATHVLPQLPKLRRAGTSALARLEEQAAAGNPRAVGLLRNLKRGQAAGSAGVGAVGAATTGTLASEESK